jgi:hypothetical protein
MLIPCKKKRFGKKSSMRACPTSSSEKMNYWKTLVQRLLILSCGSRVFFTLTMSITLACGKVETNDMALTNLVYLNPLDHEKLFGKRSESLEKQYIEMVAQKRVFVAR